MANTKPLASQSLYPGLGSLTTRTVDDKLSESVSVKDFGAVGDGVADDTTAIQDALDAVDAAGGGLVYLPSGTYNIDNSSLQVGDNTIVAGDGTSTKVVAVGELTFAQGIFYADAKSNVEIRDLYLDGTSGSDYAYYGFKAEGCTNVKVFNVKAFNFKDDCIAIGSTDYAIVENCHVGGTQTGSSGSNKSGIEYDDDCNYGIIAGNICEGREIGIHIHTHPGIAPPKYITIADNVTIGQVVETAGHYTGGILNTGLSSAIIQHLVVTGNVVISAGTQEYGIWSNYVQGLNSSNNLKIGSFSIAQEEIGNKDYNYQYTSYNGNVEYVDSGLLANSNAEVAGKVFNARRNGVPFPIVFRHNSNTNGASGGDTGTGIKFKVGTSSTAWADNGAILVRATKNASSGDTPGYMTFHTVPDGSSTLAEVGRFDDAGNFKFNSGYGSAATAYGCRAWVNFNGTGTLAMRESGNVSSVTDNNTGDYTINFTTAMPDANYAVVFGVNQATYSGTIVNAGVKSNTSDVLTNMTTSGVQIYSYYLNSTPAGGAADRGLVSVAIFR